MLRNSEIRINFYQNILHNIASASMQGFAIITPLGIVLTSFAFLAMNSVLDRSPDWNTKFSQASFERALESAAKQTDPTASERLRSENPDREHSSTRSAVRSGDRKQRFYKHFIAANSLSLDIVTSKPEWFSPKIQPSEKAIFIRLGGPEKHPCEVKCYVKKADAMLVVEFVETRTSHLLRATLWIAFTSKTNKETLSESKELIFLEQRFFPIQLTPTYAINEPSDLGKWVVHHFEQTIRDQLFAANTEFRSLFFKKAHRDIYEVFLGKLFHKLLTAKDQKKKHSKEQEENRPSASNETLIEQNFWMTFMNGADSWGAIQWVSAFAASLVILMLLARYLLVFNETTYLRRWGYQNPMKVKEELKKDAGIVYRLKQAVSQNDTEFPQVRLVTLINLLDPESNQSAEYVQFRIESSRRMIEFLINSLASIGFIGTITGIAFAINEAYKVINPDELIRLQAIKSLSSNLALAFSTTFVALILTLICDALAKRQWRKEDQLVETFTQVQQAWTWLQNGSLLEQAENSILPD